MHKDRSLDTLKATDVSPCSISAPLHCREVTPNLADCMQFESWPWHKWHDLDNKRVLRCCQKVAQPSLHIQWMLWNTWTAMDGFRCNTGSHFTCWEGTQNLVFWVHCYIVNPDWNCRVWSMSGWQRLSEASPIYLIHQMKDMKPFSSNKCLSLQHS